MEDETGKGELSLILSLSFVVMIVRGLPHPAGGPLRGRLDLDSEVPHMLDGSTWTPFGADPRRPSRRCVRVSPKP